MWTASVCFPQSKSSKNPQILQATSLPLWNAFWPVKWTANAASWSAFYRQSSRKPSTSGSPPSLTWTCPRTVNPRRCRPANVPVRNSSLCALFFAWKMPQLGVREFLGFFPIFRSPSSESACPKPEVKLLPWSLLLVKSWRSAQSCELGRFIDTTHNEY